MRNVQCGNSRLGITMFNHAHGVQNSRDIDYFYTWVILMQTLTDNVADRYRQSSILQT
ncbi:hypothetical protein FQZ97_967750 [compost metagenome]